MSLKIPPLILICLFAFAIILVPKYMTQQFFFIPSYDIISVVLSVAGSVLYLLAVITFQREQTTINPRNPEQAVKLVTTNVYHVSRNPMYLGFFFVLAAWGNSFGHLVSVLVLPGLFVVYMNKFQIQPEETALLEKFGEKYISYKMNTRRWL